MLANKFRKWLRTPAIDQFRNHAFYKASMNMLRNYPPGVKLLGDPIRSRNLSHFMRGYNILRTTDAQLTIPVQGKQRKGTLYCWGSRATIDDDFTIDKCELDVCDKRWTFYMKPDSGKDSAELVQQHVLHTGEQLDDVLSQSDKTHTQLLTQHQTP